MDDNHSDSEVFGFILSVIHGRKSQLFDSAFYNFLSQSESIEDIIVKLLGTNYKGEFSEGMEPTKSNIKRSLRRYLKKEVENIYNTSRGDLRVLLQFFIEGYSINNFFYMLNLKGSDNSIVDEIGYFHELDTLKFSNNMDDVYKFCIEPTFLNNLFKDIKYRREIAENNFQLMEAHIKKIHTEIFYDKITPKMDYMKNILRVEGNRRIVELVINSLVHVRGEDRLKIIPKVTTYTSGEAIALAQANSIDDIKNIIKIEGDENQILNKMMLQEIEAYLFSFYKFNDISTIYAYFKLKEREIQNILWVLECIKHDKKEFIGNIIKVNG